MIELDGNTKKQLGTALTKAFPKESDWERMVSYELNESLSEISSSGRTNDIAVDVIHWAISKGRLKDLVDGACRDNKTNPKLLQFYNEVWQPLIATDAKLEGVSQTSISMDRPVAPTSMDGSLDMNGSLPTPSTSGSNGASPKPMDRTQPVWLEQLRKSLLDCTTDVRMAIQCAEQMFAQERDVYHDECQIAFKLIRQKNDDLYTILSNLLKIQRVNIKLHSQFGAEKDDFKREVEKVILPINKPDNQRPLSYNVRQGVDTKLASLVRHLECIEQYICAFCDEIDQY